MRNGRLVGLAALIAAAASPAIAQRLDQPGSIAEGGETQPISSNSVAVRCARATCRMKAEVECAHSDAYQAEQARRRARRR
ncbi:hypothetical protein FSB78_06570 [Sphingomonas ginsenosidivorax]|uniref:Uncharacterized protein n=1 Tax=Sphingomonas ginsenosidivorax TaxID=862135 RepID=A0A5C6UFB4_9SPHN|nr:hypothetical protein [Sphingomonas ginsenosidivorax]TXC70638.1 hypothetical protein FSB78_06570 [Sphingomonas ginsenosidivorax]